MQQFPQYILNAANGESNQYSVNAVDVNTMLKSFIENNNTALTQTLTTPDSSYFQANKIPGSCFIQIPYNNFNGSQPYMQMVQIPTANPVYLNQQFQFPTNDVNAQYNIPQLLQMQMPSNIIQVDVNDLNKGVQQNISSSQRSRKKSFNASAKQEPGCINDSNENLPCDTKNRPLLYSCPECSRKFSMQSRLTQHKKCHSGIRPYQCQECEFAFTQKSYLVRHAAVHKDERPYVCALCKKTYKHYGSLANHRRTHKNGSKVSARSSDIAEQSMSNEISSNIKVEGEVLDMNNNLSNSFQSSANLEYLFQNPQDLQQHVDSTQSYTTQYTTDISAAQTFQSLLSSNQHIDMPFFNALSNNSINNIVATSVANLSNSDGKSDMKIEMKLHDQSVEQSMNQTSNINNSALISTEYSSQSVSFSQPSPSVTTFSV